MTSHRVYVPWFPRAINKSLKRNVRPLSRLVSLTLHDFFVWLGLCTCLINQVVIVTTFATGGAAANPFQVLRKSCLILLPTYGCLESLSGQSGMLMRR